MFPHENPLPKPDIITTPVFETLLANVKADVLAYLEQNAPQDVNAVRETFNNEAEILTKITEAFAVILQSVTRRMNAQALQMFGMYATDTAMVDLIASQLGVTRLTLSSGDANAFPPVAPVMESNEALLTRYYLAAYALASTGTRSGYRFHAMTLGGRPTVRVESPTNNKVIVTYEFAEHEDAGKTKDAQARQVAPGTVDCYILSHEGDGMPDQHLIDVSQAYLQRDDIAQETDLLTVKTPTIPRWECEAVLYLRPGPDKEMVKLAAEKAAKEYALQQHRLGGSIEPSMLYSVLLQSTGAHRADLKKPVQPLRCSYSEAPYLESINITVSTENL
ncbi:baseplate J/gp47 family protein [Shewanella sp. MF08487]|uniref:baseplate J/gp47 family protein n=1 Tax=Shewanella sp. MF08487 TaxID=3434873 RepID=UPI003D7B6D6B